MGRASPSQSKLGLNNPSKQDNCFKPRLGVCRASDADNSNRASLADGVARPEGLREILASSDLDTHVAPVILEPEPQIAMNGVTGSAADSDSESMLATHHTCPWKQV